MAALLVLPAHMRRSDGGRWEEGPDGLSCAELFPIATVKSAGNCSSTCFEEKLRSSPLVSDGQLSTTDEATSVTVILGSAWVSASGISGPVPISQWICWDVCTSPAPRQSHPLRLPPRQALGNCVSSTPVEGGSLFPRLQIHKCIPASEWQGQEPHLSSQPRAPLSEAALGLGPGSGLLAGAQALL